MRRGTVRSWSIPWAILATWVLGAAAFGGVACSPPRPDPAVALAAQAPCPQKADAGILVLGGVKKPQELPWMEGMSVVPALLLAGGFDVLADRRRVQIRRCNQVFVLDLEAITDGEREDVPLSPGDTVMVPSRD